MLQRESVPKHTLELLEKLSEPASHLGFYLAGGTALALRFGHRISVDLDFFRFGEFEVDDVLEMVSKHAKNVQVVNRSSYSVSLIAEKTKIEFLRYDYKDLKPIDELERIHLCSLSDNAVMKLSAVAGRGSKKDFFDIAEIFNHLPLPILLENYAEKYPDTDVFMILKSLTWFEDAESDPEPILKSKRTWEDVKKLILCEVSKL